MRAPEQNLFVGDIGGETQNGSVHIALALYLAKNAAAQNHGSSTVLGKRLWKRKRKLEII